MRQQAFGRLSGLRVSEYALGAANFGTSWGTGAQPAEARRMFERFAEAGGTLIDTAESYQLGESETLLGDFLAADRDHFVLATKGSTGNDRRALTRAVEGSLKRLKPDRIDLYWVHFQDGVTPIEEILHALDDLVSSGKILHAGLSNFPAWTVARGQTFAELRGWAPIAGIQVEYSLAERSADRELLPMAEALGLGVALWSPLGGGLLTGKYRHSDAGRLTDWKRLVHTEDSDQKTRTVDEVLAIATELAVPPAQVAMAWLRDIGRRSATSLVSVIGPRSVEQLEDYLGALDVTLTREQAGRLDAVSAPALGVPHGTGASMRERLLGAAFPAPAVPVA
jgi:aryl-alcohol dehydrogenase-like predicted oxidoreductase